MARIAEMPVKLCDAKVACDNPASWYMDLHGCDGAAVCDEHRAMWIYEINLTLSHQGHIPCMQCGLLFTTLPRILKERPI